MRLLAVVLGPDTTLATDGPMAAHHVDRRWRSERFGQRLFGGHCSIDRRRMAGGEPGLAESAEFIEFAHASSVSVTAME